MVYPEGAARLRAVFLGAMTSVYYAASDEERNSAKALKEFLERGRK